MELRAFAERILFGDRLEDKLVTLEGFTDARPGAAIAPPPAPGRPVSLRLDAWSDRAKVEFPGTERFSDPRARGTVLHFFANHELLAMELMALVLLRFPDAPAAFRAGVARTIAEEQSHLRQYMDRMEALGVSLGEIPVNDFFWSCISRMNSPMDFVVQMSMTFEQANLDYALHYKNLMRAVGDIATADVLDAVYEDEIGHVKHGLAWFHRFKDESEDEWDAYVSRLRFPLTPARAKGIGFSREARARAGFSQRYVEELSVYSQSKGRPPAIHVFNPTAELEFAHAARAGGRASAFSPNARVAQLCADMETLPMFVAARDDVVLVREAPTTAFLSTLRDAGFRIPEFVEYGGLGSGLPRSLENRKIGALQPWGWSPASMSFFGPHVARSVQGARHPSAALLDETPFLPKAGTDSESARAMVRAHPMAQLYSKATSVSWLAELLSDPTFAPDSRLCPSSWIGRICQTPEEVMEARALHAAQGFERTVVKACFGASGQNAVRVDTLPLGVPDARWVEKTLEGQGAVVAEPWLDKVSDTSVQIKVEDARVLVCGVTRFVTNGRGQYVGTLLGRRNEGLPPDVVRYLYGNGANLSELSFMPRFS